MPPKKGTRANPLDSEADESAGSGGGNLNSPPMDPPAVPPVLRSPPPARANPVGGTVGSVASTSGSSAEARRPALPNEALGQGIQQIAAVMQVNFGNLIEQLNRNHRELYNNFGAARDQQQAVLLRELRQAREADRIAEIARHNEMVRMIQLRQANDNRRNDGSPPPPPRNNRNRGQEEVRVPLPVGGNGPPDDDGDDDPIRGNGRNNDPILDGNGGPRPNQPLVPVVNNAPGNLSHHLKQIEVPKFKGFEDSKTAYEFVLEMEKYQAISRNDDNFMLRYIVPAALQGSAYVWYRSELKDAPFNTWDDFKARFRREFQGWGYEIDLRRNLDVRTQGPDEPLTVFIQVIQEYYERLGVQAGPEEIISRIKRQMHPEFLRVLHGKPINTLRELKDAAIEAQEIIKAYRVYRPPPMGPSVEPSLVYKPVERLASIPIGAVNAPSDYEREAPRLHVASVDPFTYYHHGTVTKKQVNFSKDELVQNIPRTYERPRESRSPSPNRGTGFQPRSVSPQPPGGSVNNQQVREAPICYGCGEPGHLRPNCPNAPPRSRSPNPGNGRSPSPSSRQ
jgi:hypothetical protein